MNETALSAIQKKLLGKNLSYKEIFAIMDEIAHHRLGTVLTTYFAASGYSRGFCNEEIYFLTKAMMATGERLHFPGIVADKHSIGGVPGTRTSLIVVPLIAAAGFTIPKSSSRAITTPGGTADDMEVLAPVTFNKEKIYDLVKKVNACIVWGGGVDIAPADDALIKVEEPLLLESYDKILVSIMAKKLAFGSTHVIIDVPYGAYLKVQNKAHAELMKKKFLYLAARFHITLGVYVHKVEQPAGRGIGPILEAREALKVLEQQADRPIDLEIHALKLATLLLELCVRDADNQIQAQVSREFVTCHAWAKHLLTSGRALEKMHEIILAQGGRRHIASNALQPGRCTSSIPAEKSGSIKAVNSRNITIIARILGAPVAEKAGIYLQKKIGESTRAGEPVCILYSQSAYQLKEARESLKHFPIFQWH